MGYEWLGHALVLYRWLGNSLAHARMGIQRTRGASGAGVAQPKRKTCDAYELGTDDELCVSKTITDEVVMHMKSNMKRCTKQILWIVSAASFTVYDVCVHTNSVATIVSERRC